MIGVKLFPMPNGEWVNVFDTKNAYKRLLQYKRRLKLDIGKIVEINKDILGNGIYDQGNFAHHGHFDEFVERTVQDKHKILTKTIEF